MLHSPRHTGEVRDELGLTRQEAMRAALPYAVAAAAGGSALALAMALWGITWDTAAAPVIFIGLACLTVPHIALELVTKRPAWRNAVGCLLLSAKRGEDPLRRRRRIEVMEALPRR